MKNIIFVCIYFIIMMLNNSAYKNDMLETTTEMTTDIIKQASIEDEKIL